MTADYSPELSAHDIRDRQPVLTRAWNFETEFDKVFNDDESRMRIAARAFKEKRPYRKINDRKRKM